MSYYRHKLPRTGYGLGAGGQQTVNDKIQSYPVISTSLISTSRYLDINLWSRQKQSLFNVKLPGYLDISYVDVPLSRHNYKSPWGITRHFVFFKVFQIVKTVKKRNKQVHSNFEQSSVKRVSGRNSFPIFVA